MEDNKRLEQGFDDPERQVIKRNIVHFTDTSEIKHFAEVKVSQYDNVYGVTWAELVREYLITAYSEENTQAEIISYGVTYKVLRRGKVTVFYDADGNTLFDVENTRLEKEYAWIMKASTGIDEDCQNEENKEILPENMDTVKEMNENVTEVKEGVQPEKNVETLIENLEKSKEAETVTDDTSELEGNVKEQDRQKLEEELKKAEESVQNSSVYIGVVGAVTKLQKELKKAKEKNFAKPVIEHLIERCKNSESLASDVCQDHKTWEKCYKYIYDQARKQIKGSSGAVRDDVVYEWAEDYYHKDDKAEEEKKAKKEAEAKAKREKAADERKDQAKEKPSSVAALTIPKKEDKRKEKGQKNSKDMEGQMDMFSLMGM